MRSKSGARDPWPHEPGTGEINYRNVFKAIYELGDRCQGYAALEYHPLAPPEENLAAMRKMASFAWQSGLERVFVSESPFSC